MPHLSTAISGTQEEFELAKNLFRNLDAPMRQIVVLFKGVAEQELPGLMFTSL